MQGAKFYAQIQLKNENEAKEASDKLRRLAAETYLFGNTLSVFCFDLTGLKISRVKSVCCYYQNLKTA